MRIDSPLKPYTEMIRDMCETFDDTQYESSALLALAMCYEALVDLEMEMEV